MRTLIIAGLIAFVATGAQAAGGSFGGGHGGGGSFGGGQGGGGRPGGHRPPPPHQAPEIDVMSGAGALATLGAAGALFWERRRRPA